MPKGVYNRTKAINIQRVEVMPDPQPANKNEVEAVPQTHGEDNISTSEKLFGDIIARDEAEAKEEAGIQDPAVQAPPAQEPEPVKREESAPEEPVVQPEPVSEEFIDLDKFADKKVKVKIDGVEDTVPFKELHSQYQIRRHLNQVADKVGEERRKLAEERRQLQESRQQQRPTYDPNSYPAQPGLEPNVMPDPNNPFVQQLNSLQQQINNMAMTTQPMVYQSNRMRLDQSLKARGFTDFDDYWPKVQANVSQDLINNLNGNEMAAAEMVYLQLKAQDLSQPRQVVQPQVRPPVVAPRAPNTQVASVSQPSSGINDDSNTQYRSAFKRAVERGDDREAWNDLLFQKGIIK